MQKLIADCTIRLLTVFTALGVSVIFLAGDAGRITGFQAGLGIGLFVSVFVIGYFCFHIDVVVDSAIKVYNLIGKERKRKRRA